jgi:membrane protease YdiL (CAAX protease family)
MIVAWLNTAVHSRWLTFLSVALLAPAGEEILFRGLLFGAMRGRLSASWTILVTAALFALMHLQPIYFMPLFAMGLVLGWARDRSSGLALPIMLHCINNCTALLVAMQHSTSGA